MKPTFRRMTPEDISRIAELEEQLFEDSWSAQSFKTEVENIDVSYPVVMELERQIMGYAVVWYYADELHIANFAIAREYQCRGFGRVLLRHIMEKETDFAYAYLEVRKSNKAAILLYSDFGFLNLYIRKGYYRNGEDALVMVYNNHKIEKG